MSICSEAGGLAALEAAITEVEAAESHLTSVTECARAKLHESVTALTRVANTMWTGLDSSTDLRAIAARRLYWGVPSLPPDNIAVALGYRSKREMTAAAGAVDSGVTCVDCEAEIKVSSRAELKELSAAASASTPRRSWRGDGRARCRPCKDAQRQREQEEQERRWKALDEREDDTIIEWPWEL